MPGETLRALLIEDNPGDARLIREMLRETGGHGASVALEHVDRLERGLQRLSEGGIDAVLLDLSLPDSQGLETFARVRAHTPALPVVVLSGQDDESVAVRAVQEGAQDYLVKGQVSGNVILRSLLYAVERTRLEEARRDLEHQRDRFFSSISHDLRTPIAAIKASLGVVLSNEPKGMPEPLHRMLANADQAADELQRLVDDLLQIARLQAGRVDLWLMDGDLRDVVRRYTEQAEPLMAARHQKLELRLPPDPVPVRMDAERLGRALTNLVGNAQKYGRENGHVWVSVEVHDDEARVVVADDGPGIDPAEHERIFQPYYRTPQGEAGGQPGSGLGLAIARSLVELHGGRLWVENAPGAGARFSLALPLAGRAAAAAGSAAPLSGPAREPGAAK